MQGLLKAGLTVVACCLQWSCYISILFLCRVDSHRVVKVADFGLSRELFCRDYYRIGDDKTPLPVRWMAPESLKSSVFTTQSDVVSINITSFHICFSRHHRSNAFVFTTLCPTRQHRFWATRHILSAKLISLCAGLKPAYFLFWVYEVEWSC